MLLEVEILQGVVQKAYMLDQHLPTKWTTAKDPAFTGVAFSDESPDEEGRS
jgi:hypothetical protein